MPSDYERILQENLHEYGHGERHLAFLGRLYTDRTHFVYELLQNAEDAAATRVKFVLHADRLEVLHDGRVFNEADVRGVCGVGGGTKEEDLTQIGKFGIGFKSVYAFTRTPAIHSGGEHFCITSYVRPSALGDTSVAAPWSTLFRFPFDHPDVSAETAFREVAERLEKLGLRTLLFLRNIKEIEWEVAGKTAGTYLREAASFREVADRISLVGQTNERDVEEQWVVFRRSVAIPTHEAIDEKYGVRVEAAFRIEESEEDSALQIARLTDSPLVVFFPTDKPTGLGFLIQGPYRTTPARDNIPQHDDWNTHLVVETGELLVKVLQVFRREGCLSPGVLETLPIQPDAFPEDGMFRPLFDRVLEAFRTEPLLPADGGAGTSANDAVLARGAGLRDLLSSSQLCQLLGAERSFKWLTRKITQDRTPVLRNYLVRELGVLEFTPERLARGASEEFLEQQSDAWMIQFYTYLLRQEGLWAAKKSGRSEGLLRRQPIVRLSDGRHVPPFRPDGTTAAYLPTSCDLAVPFVHRSIASDEQAGEFLHRLGLREPDLVDEVLATVLPKYDGSAGACLSDDKDYALDVKAIVAAIRTDSSTKRERVVNRATNTPFLLARNAVTGSLELRKPAQVYVRSDDLASYFSENPNAWFMAEDPSLKPLEAKDRQVLGIAEVPRFIEFSPELTWQERSDLRRGMRSSRDDTIVDYDIDGLAEALARIERLPKAPDTVRMARIIWEVLLKQVRKRQGQGFWQARYDWFYYHERVVTFDATFLRRLTTTAWLPKLDGVLCMPSQIDVSELPEGFELHDEIIEKLGITNAQDQQQEELTDKKELAAQLGVELTDIEFVRSHPDEFVRWRDAVVASKSVRPAFPERTPTNPARRETRIRESLGESPAKAYETRERSVRVSAPASDPATWLRHQYTNEDGQMVCQMCEREMPFKKRNGEYYFEAVELTRNAGFEHRALHVALCPVCAAKYKEFIKTDPQAQVELESTLATATSPCIGLTLGCEVGSLRFVETHLVDAKALIGRSYK